MISFSFSCCSALRRFLWQSMLWAEQSREDEILKERLWSGCVALACVIQGIYSRQTHTQTDKLKIDTQTNRQTEKQRDRQGQERIAAH